MAVQTTVSTRASIAIRDPKSWVYVGIACVALLNLIALFAYQHYLAADFPYEDEIGYVNRLVHLHETGFFHYLFDRYQTYYQPGYFFVWYDFYKLTHLSITAVRYTGACVSAITGLLLSVMLYRNTQRLDPLSIAVILTGPFVMCSYNYWATYVQSIESVMEPLVFGLILTLAWVASRIFSAADNGEGTRTVAMWSALGVALWLVASGIYAPPLVFLIAVMVARVLLTRKLGTATILLSIVAFAVPIAYALVGQSLNQELSATHAGIGFQEIINACDAAISLLGNALFSPLRGDPGIVTRLLGVTIFAAQIGYVIYTLRLPQDERKRFLIPLTLAIYTMLVIAEIIATRLYEPGLGFTPRYSMHTLGAPVSLMFWFVLIDPQTRWRRALGLATLATMIFGLAYAYNTAIPELPYIRATLGRVRETMMSLEAPPTPQQQAEMYVSQSMLPLIYPDLEFMRARHLAMYANAAAPTAIAAAPSAAPPAQALEGPLLVRDFGPANIEAKTPFHVRPDGLSSMWLRLNWPVQGKAYLVINGTKLHAVHRENIMAAEIPRELYERAGDYPMFVLIEAADGTSMRSNTVRFIVH